MTVHDVYPTAEQKFQEGIAVLNELTEISNIYGSLSEGVLGRRAYVLGELLGEFGGTAIQATLLDGVAEDSRAIVRTRRVYFPKPQMLFGAEIDVREVEGVKARAFKEDSILKSSKGTLQGIDASRGALLLKPLTRNRPHGALDWVTLFNDEGQPQVRLSTTFL